MPFNTCTIYQNQSLRFYRNYHRYLYHRVFSAVKNWVISNQISQPPGMQKWDPKRCL